MHGSNQVKKSGHKYLILLALIGFFSSCNTYNFSTPQPVNGNKLTSFPQTLLGQWRDNGKKNEEVYEIHEKFFSLVVRETQTVIRGICPSRLEKGDSFNLSGQDFLFKVKFDSAQIKSDTVPNYIIRGKIIYHVCEDKSLDRGYPFVSNGDTITISRKDSLTIDLGNSAILKALGPKVYVISLRNRLLNLNDRTGDWWQIRILRQIDQDRWEIMGFSSIAKSLPCIFQTGDTTSTDYYSDCAWSKSDMLHLMNEGLFNDRDTIVRVRQK